MKTVDKILKYLAIAVLICVMPKACRMEYTCDMIDSMPEPIYQQLLATYPDWNIDRIADYYMDNRDSLETEMHLEQKYLSEFEEYRRNNPEEFEEIW